MAINTVYRLEFAVLAEALVVLLAICTNVTPSYSKTVPGFVSVDCGSNSSEYKDTSTGLTWESDHKYIQTGMTGAIPHPINQSLDNHQALRTFRYFPKALNKECYELPVSTSNIFVLVRAMFYHGNSPELVLPIEFDVYINATEWSSIEYGTDSDLGDLMNPIVLEGIFFSPGNVTNFCLKPAHGAPFISSLELRRLDREGVMVSFETSQGFLLSNFGRLNFGGSVDAPTVRYPDDPYDRLWGNSASLGELCLDDSYKKKFSLPANVTTSSKFNNVPLKVMAEACDTTSSILSLPFPAVPGLLYAIFYFYSPNGSLSNISLNSAMLASTEPPVNVVSHITLKSYANIVQEVNKTSVSVTGIVNAVELYEETFFNTSSTEEDDALFIDFLKTNFNLTEWQGDPCTPVAYGWITCSTHGDTTNYLSSFSLSNLSDSTRLASYSNPFTGLTWLSKLSIVNSDIDDATFQFLATQLVNLPNANGGGFAVMDMTQNQITMLPSSSLSNWLPPNSLNLSQNRLQGEVPNFLNYSSSSDFTTTPGGPTVLNFSGNLFTSFPNSWGDSTSGLTNLVVLDLSHNNLTGSMSSLTKLFQKNNKTLQEIDISNNNLMGASRGAFNTTLYFSDLPSLKSLNMANTGINGTLDLTAWYGKLKVAANQQEKLTSELDLDATSPIDQLFSFVQNSISDIVPGAEVLQNTIDSLMNSNGSRFNQSGVLLGGNPYCENAKSQIQKYLCRSSTNQIIYATHSTKKHYLLYIGLPLGGAFLLAVIFVLFFSIWRLRKQVDSLREIQKELADRKVQPPYYSYSDIKLATRNFHKDNELGSGTFGIVYKGVLQDKNVVAVKRLFNSQNVQVLNDFLNEVVLITGIKHKNLIQLTGCCIKETERILVYEYAENGNVADALWGKKSAFLDWRQRLNICVGTARGLSYLHEELQPRIIHRDIKAANVLLDKGWQPKIADFGLAKPILEEDTQAQFTLAAGTRGYFAPEYLLEGHLSEKADVFSFGILVLEIMSGRKCIDMKATPEKLYLKNWAESLKVEGNAKLLDLLEPELARNCDEGEALKVLNIALSCIQNNPKRRARMSRVVNMLCGDTEVIEVVDKAVRKEFLNNNWLKKVLAGGNLESEEFSLLGTTSDDHTNELSFFDSPQNDPEGSSGLNSSVSSTSGRFGRKLSKGKMGQ